ncbi:unnamed protein product [Pleuronectes platessa]|uniref:Uncharacterized protein n=1 Tax=Pleuronectes platessa TaxID=8262 RepID=A0A9N7Y5C9_PLEPL|nr:unnamed protein product [Pleuronectes platessa]
MGSRPPSLPSLVLPPHPLLISPASPLLTSACCSHYLSVPFFNACVFTSSSSSSTFIYPPVSLFSPPPRSGLLSPLHLSFYALLASSSSASLPFLLEMLSLLSQSVHYATPV